MQNDLIKDLEALRLFSPGDRVLVALSGGADSVVLLHLLQEFARRTSLELRAAHLDHGMRAASGRDAAFVRRLCAQWGVPLIMGREDVPGLARRLRTGLEDAARQARRRFLCETARSSGCQLIALGHHRGDQAETFLHRLLRGAGATGLAAMRPHAPPFVRPLLGFSRSRLQAYLAEHRLPHAEDESNTDLRFTRNRIRHELLPLLRKFNPAIEAHLAALAGRFALEEGYWQQQGELALAELGEQAGGRWYLDRDGLLALHPALRARVLRLALARLRGDLAGISSRHLQAVEGLLEGEAPQGEVHLPGAWVGRRYGRLLLSLHAPVPVQEFSLAIEGPGDYGLPDGRQLTVSIEAAARGEGPLAVEFAAERVGFPLLVRTFRAGDRFRPAGGKGAKKLKDFFIDCKLEREIRTSVPLLVGREVLWVMGIRRCAGMRPEQGGGPVLRMVVTQQNLMRIGL